jgi:hypothetical protein
MVENINIHQKGNIVNVYGERRPFHKELMFPKKNPIDMKYGKPLEVPKYQRYEGPTLVHQEACWSNY